MVYEWHDKEIEFLKQLHDVSIQQSKEYMKLYRITHAKQSRLRLPAIILSSFSGVASFGTQSFPKSGQKFVSIVVGIINITIAMIQTYESYLKIAEIVSKSLTVATSLKKLADDIFCEIYIPIEDRETAGVAFLRDCFSRYQTIVDSAPPLPPKLNQGEMEERQMQKQVLQAISSDIKKEERVQFGKTFHRMTIPSMSRMNKKFGNNLPKKDHVYPPDDDVSVQYIDIQEDD